MIVKIEKNQKYSLPSKKHITDAAFDLYAKSFRITDDFIEYDTEIITEIPEGYCGLVFARSSISNYNLILANGVGIIDSGYRSTWKIRFKIVPAYEATGIDQSDEGILYINPTITTKVKIYKIGDRIAQMMILPLEKINFMEVESLEETSRGLGGFGSTDSPKVNS